MSIVVILKVTASDGNTEAVKQLFIDTLPDTRAFDGCNGVSAYTVQDQPDVVTMIEKWESREHYEKYMAWRSTTSAMGELMELAAGPPSIEYLDLFDQ